MAYKLKRIGKKAYKFEYSLVLHSLTIEVNRPKFSPNQVSIAFSRRGKRLYSKLIKWEPSINNPSHGHIVWPEPERLTTIVTLYKGQKDNTYDNKEWEISVIEVNREGNKKCLGKKAIDMSDFIGDVLGYSQDLKLRLNPAGRKMKLLSLDCSLHSRFVRAGMSTDADMRSQSSQLSVSALSSISDTEDLDLADLADLDSEINNSYGESFEPEVIKPSPHAPPSYIKHEDLLAWSQKCVQGYHGVTIRNFTTSWRNGLAFSAIIHHHRPDLLDFESLDPLDVTRNNKIAFEAAHTLGVPRIIRAEQMDQWLVPDRLLVTSFIYQLFIRLEGPENIPTGGDSVDQLNRSHTWSSTTSPGSREEEKKPRRLLPPTPKQAPNISPDTQKRVQEFLSGLDHASPSREKKDPFSDYKQDRKRKTLELNRPGKGLKAESPFFGRKAERKIRSEERARQEQPYIPNEVGRQEIEVTASIALEFEMIDYEFDSKDLFENALLNKAEIELTPKTVKKQTAKEMGSIGKKKPHDTLLDIIYDPAILQKTKLTKKKSKNQLTHNPLYSSQEPEGFSSSDTSVSESGTCIVPSKLTNTVTTCSKLRDTFCKRDGSVKRDRKTKETASTQSKTSLQGNSESCCKTAVKKLAHIKSRKEKRRRVPVKGYEQEHTLLLKKYASVPHMEEMNSDDNIQEVSDGPRSDADSPTTERRTHQSKRSLSLQYLGYTSELSDDSKDVSSYSHLLTTQLSVTDDSLDTSDTHTHRLLDAYDARIGPQLVQNRQHAPRQKNGDRRAVVSAFIDDSMNGIDKFDKEEPGEIKRKYETMPGVSRNTPARSSLFSEETDYIAHMQKKLCSMQISIEARQEVLKDQVIEAERNSDNELEKQLMENLVQLVQQKAQLDNRYDDLMAIAEERDPLKKEDMLRRELKHKKQIDRSIKSREQLWEEEVLEKEIKEAARERRDSQLVHISPTRSPTRNVQSTLEVVEVIPPNPPTVRTQTSNKGKELGWRDRILNILA